MCGDFWIFFFFLLLWRRFSWSLIMHSTMADHGETDRQMVLIHVDNTLLAMRASNRLNRRKSGGCDEMSEDEYAAAQGLLELQRRLFAGAVPVPGPNSSSSPIRQHDARLPTTPSSSISSQAYAAGSSGGGGDAAAAGAVALFESSPFSTSQLLPLSSNVHCEVSEVTILSAFASVCRSASTSAVVTGVALTALVDMLDLPCGFISTYGVHTAIEAASDTCAEVHDNGSHEVLLSRIFSVYVAALSHPAAAMAEGGVHVRAIGRMMMLATLPEASQLLKRTVEKSMRCIVITLFRRLLHLSSDPAEREAVVAASTVVLQFISRLIGGEVASFDNDGREVAASAVGGSESYGSASASSGDERESPMERSIALVQLEGLSLAQDCLLLLHCSLDSPVCAPLLDTVQNQLCRSLLIAGLGATRSIVLAQVLRTVHLVMQGASEHLIPQIYNFIRVLHLNPLETLTNELSDAGVPNGAFSPPAPANSPVRKMSPGSPSSTTSGSAFMRLSRMQLQRKQERRDILLDSLAEFCSDPRFGSFCFLHYDLSWRYASLLPQLSQVLVNSAYPMGRDENAALDRFDGRISGGGGGGGGGRSSVLQRRRAGREAGSGGSGGGIGSNGSKGGGGGTSTGPTLQRTRRAALDAATNMVASIALRAIDAGSPSSAASSSYSSSSQSKLRSLTRQAMKEKEMLSRFAALFEDSPMKKGIPFLLEHAVQVPRGTEEQASIEHRTQFIVAAPAGGREIGEALYRLSIVLNKRVLGDYIGEQGRDKAESASSPLNGGAVPALFTVLFFEEQLNGFIHQFQFRDKPLLTAIREMVYLLCLPGESQKIDRVMEAFAKHWYKQNVTRLPNGEVHKDELINPFHGESGAFVLSFAIIMLNTDQHSGKVAHQMKKDDFIKMNRGIDDGKDVPAEYLGHVYDDVRLHEVVMADMMDRGFGNDTTWRLEMRPCTSFLQLALADTATSAAAQGNAETVESLASMSGRESATVHTQDRSALLRTFDPFLFQSLWKRSLLVFDGVLESAVDDVAQALVARGTSLAEAVADAQRRLPFEMSVLQSSLRGVSMLARAAHAFGMPAVADQCLLVLLQHVAMDLSSAEEEVRLFFRSVPKMLCLAEVFALFADVHSSLKDSWMPLARLVLDMQLMGLFVDHDEKAASRRRSSRGGKDGGNDGSQSTSDDAEAEKDGSAGYLAVLLQDPGICASVFAPLTSAAAAAPKQNGDKGWFSSLFGSNEASQMSEAQLDELRAAQLRLRSCIPDMRHLLSLLRLVAADPACGSRCVMSLCAACSVSAAPLTPQAGETVGKGGSGGGSGNDGAHNHERVRADRIVEAAAYAASFELSLICAVVGGASTPDVLQPDHLGPLTARVSRLLGEVGVFLSDCRADSNARHYWLSVGSRVVSSAVHLMAAHWRGQEGAVALEQLWTCWMRAPAIVFTTVVAPHVASFLYHLVVVEDAQAAVKKGGEAEAEAATATPPPRLQLTEQAAPWSSGSEVLVLLAPFATHAAATTDVTVQRQVSAILFYVVRQGLYSVAEDTESIVSLCLSFSVWARETSESGNGGGGRAKEHAPAASGLPSSASVVEILSLCGRNVLFQHTGRGVEAMHDAAKEANSQHAMDGAAASTISGGWYSQWLFVLRSLGALALCSPEARDGSEALLCLQHVLLDSEARDLPVSAVVAVYKDILIPLAERLCVPKAKVQAGLKWNAASSGNSSGGAAAATSADGNNNNSSSGNKRGMIGSLFNALVAPSSGSAAGEAAAASPARYGAASSSAPLVSTEVKCRLLSLVPKVLLRYTAALTHDQEALVALWRQVLGTLYAVYSAYPESGTSSDSAQDEAMLVQEAVEETVKNMIYVMAATWKDPVAPLQLAGQAAAFWEAIARLVQPFPFAAPLLEFMLNEHLIQAASTGPPISPSSGIV